MEITSSAFKSGTNLPEKYSCDGAGVSPPLQWTGVPGEAKSLALILEDPDAPSGAYAHWVLYGIPATVSSLDEGVPSSDRLAWGGVQGRNSARGTGYTAPCPPQGPAHHYYFRLYALDAELALPPGLTRERLLARIQDNVIDQASLLAMYRRQ